MTRTRNRTDSARTENARTDSARDTSFGPANLYFGAAAAAAIGAGFVLLSQGSIVAAPILLVLGYVVLVPLAFLY